MDVLADVLRALRLRGTAYFQAHFRAPWGMQMERGDVANFHVLVAGRCCVTWEGAARPTELGAGDIIVFPHGVTHALSDRPGTPTPAARDLLGTRREAQGGRTEFGADGPATEIICGHFEIDRATRHPLLAALPAVLLLRRGEGTDAEWIATATRLAVLESNGDRPGSSAVVDRLAEALMIQLVRAHGERADLRTGFLAALGDSLLAPALRLIHDEPGEAWSVELLARRIGVSRSSFAARFKDVMGTSPMQYVTDWRMHRARQLLQSADLSVAEVAERVGYQSEFSFAKAFKRVFGQGPGAARRAS